MTSIRRILALEKLGAVFNQVSTPVQYTPRKFVIHHESNNLVVIETDHNAYTDETKQQRKQQMAEVLSSFRLVFRNFMSLPVFIVTLVCISVFSCFCSLLGNPSIDCFLSAILGWRMCEMPPVYPFINLFKSSTLIAFIMWCRRKSARIGSYDCMRLRTVWFRRFFSLYWINV